MKNFKNYFLFIAIIMLMVSFTSCGDDDNNQEEDVFAGCCSEEPVFGPNVDNLDQSVGEIIVYNLFTPNGDGINDYFGIENIELYNHTVTIYNSEDEVIFETNSYASPGDFFPNAVQTEQGMAEYPDGTYKYKIVVESEQVYRKSGTFCLFGNFSALDEQNFSECVPNSWIDPTLTGF
jgi:hypothetical protein